MKTKIISILLTASLLLSYASIPVIADDEVNEIINNETQQSEEILPTSLPVNNLNVIPQPTASPEATATPKAKKVLLTASGAVDKSSDLQAGTIELESGAYGISDVDTANTIVIKSGAIVDLDLNNVVITSAVTSPIMVEAGATLNLNVSGTNTLTSDVQYFPAIAVECTTEGVAGELFISGDGTLNAITNKKFSAAIGSVNILADASKYSGAHGTITINSGTVVARGTAADSTGIGVANKKLYPNTIRSGDITINGGTVTAESTRAAIGAARETLCANIIINGGTVNATSKYYTIGGAGVNGSEENGSITINGGNVNTSGLNTGRNGLHVNKTKIEINGGNINASSNIVPVNKHNQELEIITVQIPNGANKEVELGTGLSHTDSEGNLVCYLPIVDEASGEKLKFSVKCDGVLYYTEDVKGEELQIYDGPDCSCTQDNLVINIDVPSSVSVNKLTKVEAIDLNAKLDFCEYPLHDYTVSYECILEDGGQVPREKAYIDEEAQKLYCLYDGVGTTIRLKVIVGFNGFEKIITRDISITADDVSRFDLSQGKITIKRHTSDLTAMIVTVGDKSYSVKKSEEVYIYQSNPSKETYNNIYINTNARVVIDGVNIHTTQNDQSLDYCMMVGDVNATVRLINVNKMKADGCIALLPAGDTITTLTLTGDGTLDVTSGDGPAIGRMKQLTINSGTIIAHGGKGGAGIGGAASRAGFPVTINGGRVYAYGNGSAAGIGGGQYGAGGDFVMTGGYVYARNDNTDVATIGDGNGASREKPGTVTITGGSIDATLPLRTLPTPLHDSLSYIKNNEYRVEVSLEDVEEQGNVTYTIDDGAPVSTSTDENGKLYLYMGTGMRWIRVYKDGVTYYRYIEILQKNGDNTKTVAVKDPVAKMTHFEIAGQIGETDIDEENKTISLTVPYNIRFESIKPIYEYNGAEITSNTRLNFANENHEALLTVTGNDKIEKTYKIKLTLADEPPTKQPAVFDVSKGAIIITDTFVEYGGVEYSTNELGYRLMSSVDGPVKSSIMIVSEEGGSIPPITLDNININSASNGMQVYYTDLDVTVIGDCRIQSVNTAFQTRTESSSKRSTINFHLNENGDYGSLLFTQLSEGGYCANIPRTTIENHLSAFALASLNNNAINGTDSKLLTDSKTYVKLSQHRNNGITVTDYSDTPLYQLVAHLEGTDAESNECEYGGVGCYLDDNHDLCLMVPNGEYSLHVDYDDAGYDGTTTVDSATQNVTLKTMTIEKVEYDNTQLPHSGKQVDFSISGDLADGTEIGVRLTPNRDDAEVLTGKATCSNGKCIVGVIVPENTSKTDKISYTVEVLLGKKVYQQTRNIVISQNNTEALITAFEMQGQMLITHSDNTTSADTVIANTVEPTESKAGRGSISVYFPYDYEFTSGEFYEASKLTFVGKEVLPQQGEKKKFNLYSDNDSLFANYYTVTAKDGKTKRNYTVLMKHRPTPTINHLSVTGTISDYKGGNVTVTATGQSTNYLTSAYKEENRHVYIDIYDGETKVKSVEAEKKMVDIYGTGALVAQFVATNVGIGENSDMENKKQYTLKARIGNTEQKAVETVDVPRKPRNKAGLNGISVENEMSNVKDDTAKTVTVTVPYDVDITAIEPEVDCDAGATYSPAGEVDFTHSPVSFTITSEDGKVTNTYKVSVIKQTAPTVSAVMFTPPRYSSAGNVEFTLTGQNLENLKNAVTKEGGIVVKCTDPSGKELTGTVKESDGSYKTTIKIPSNSTGAAFNYTVTVEVAGVKQTLTGGDPTLTIPAIEPNSCELTDVILAEGQGEPSINGNELEIVVPYNTELENVAPLEIRMTGVESSPAATERRNFLDPRGVQYTIKAENGDTKTYTVKVIRGGYARVNYVVPEEPVSYKPSDVTVQINGDFIPYESAADKAADNKTDELKMTATPKDGGTPLIATIEYDKYSGSAIAHFTNVPPNTSGAPVTYKLALTLKSKYNNNIEVPQNLGFADSFTVTYKKPNVMKSFEVERQIGTADIQENTVTFNMPYSADFRTLVPTITIDADSITPASDTAQNFESGSVEYTLKSEDMPDHKYTVTANRLGSPTLDTVTVTNAPTTFKGTTTELEFTGVFHFSAAVKAIPSDDSEELEGTVVMDTNRNRATAQLIIPDNNTTADREYTLVFYLDGFTDGIYSDTKIVVPRRSTRAFTKFEFDIQDGETRFEGTDVYVDIPYNLFRDMESIAPTIEADADEVMFAGQTESAIGVKANFGDLKNPVKYTLKSIDDTPITYTVHIQYVGAAPKITSFTVENQTKDTEYEDDNISLILPANANLKEVTPIVEYVGVDYSPKSPQDFTLSKTEPVVYTVVDKYGIEHKYNVTITKKKKSGKKATPTPTVAPTATPTATDKPSVTSSPTPHPQSKPYMSGYEENGLRLFKPDNNLTRAEVATILSKLDGDFKEGVRYDVAGGDVDQRSWYAEYVNYAVTRGYMSGYEDGTYRPENSITRAEFAALVARYMGIEPLEDENKFVDIDDVPWCAAQLNALSEKGIISGYDGNLFKPYNKLTRAEAAAIINRMLKRSIPEEELTGRNNPFADVMTSHWAYGDILAACED